MENERPQVRARDLRPGDVILTGYRVRRVKIHGDVVSVVVTGPRTSADLMGYCLADQWLTLDEEGA